MRLTLLVVLLVSAVLIERSESKGWLGRTWQKIKQAARDVVDWIDEHCSTSGGGIRCEWRRKREAGYGPPDPHYVKSKRELCLKVFDDDVLLREGISFELFKDVFEVVDGGLAGDGVLDDKQFEQFMEALTIFHECLSEVGDKQQ